MLRRHVDLVGCMPGLSPRCSLAVKRSLVAVEDFECVYHVLRRCACMRLPIRATEDVMWLQASCTSSAPRSGRPLPSSLSSTSSASTSSSARAVARTVLQRKSVQKLFAKESRCLVLSRITTLCVQAPCTHACACWMGQCCTSGREASAHRRAAQRLRLWWTARWASCCGALAAPVCVSCTGLLSGGDGGSVTKWGRCEKVLAR